MVEKESNVYDDNPIGLEENEDGEFELQKPLNKDWKTVNKEPQ